MTEPDHQQFLERLDRSRPAVHAVADWLRWNGKAATVPETRYAPSFDVHKEYADNGDIFLANGRLVEVKHLTINFTSAADWPFREFFIDSQARVARLVDNVDAYIALSADYAAMGMVLPKTREHWYFTETRNGNTGKVVHNVACSLEHVSFDRSRSASRTTATAASWACLVLAANGFVASTARSLMWGDQ